ncbi:uncharacterized protein LOC118102232 [Hippoglossus stenolepis]|uniref:uncharacterized protein LOC118102232 n=1 Tax=Hippoglossus stenolepis TaxID=195615 RepID=UPI001FAEDE32|nr:uncharacterized protein LOC118102232 [Hippoglossus stenolepis]
MRSLGCVGGSEPFPALLCRHPPLVRLPGIQSGLITLHIHGVGDGGSSLAAVMSAAEECHEPLRSQQHQAQHSSGSTTQSPPGISADTACCQQVLHLLRQRNHNLPKYQEADTRVGVRSQELFVRRGYLHNRGRAHPCEIAPLHEPTPTPEVPATSRHSTAQGPLHSHHPRFLLTQPPLVAASSPQLLRQRNRNLPKCQVVKMNTGYLKAGFNIQWGYSLRICNWLRQYHFVSDAKTWTEAQSYCRETYTDLATIENTEEMKKLKDTVSAAGHSSEVWIGLFSHIDWKWSDGFNQSGAEYRRWGPSDPNFSQAFCVVQTEHVIWYDSECHVHIPFVCYRGTLEDSDFVLVDTTKNWSEAQRHCREHYTDLVTVRNNADRDKIHNLKPAYQYVWIGLYRDPQFYWSDGSNYSFSSWYQGDNPLGSMKVVCGVADLGGKWRLFPCEERKPFVCYSVSTVKTLVKVRVELQDSSVDLNDPAVKEQILKELQERLKEKGLSGVTLKWREKADGKVFHKEEKGSDKKKKSEL